MVELADDRQPQPYMIDNLWHNAFDDILGDRAEELRTRRSTRRRPTTRGP